MSQATVVYTDGACLGNPGPGGWAWAVPGGRFASGPEVRTTNQRMELAAVLEATRALDGPLEVVSDSTYVVNCFRDRWWEAWLARGWRTKAKKAVANQDLWEPLVEIARTDPGRLQFRWVKGHGTDTMNDLVDRLAVEAAQTQAGRSGSGTPTDLGPADVPGRLVETHGQDPDVPVGHLVAVAGHRPPQLGGYEANPTTERLRRRLREVLAAKRQLHPDLTVLTGLGLGAEQLAAEAATAAGIPYVAVLAFPDPDAPWPAATQARYRRLLAGAASQIVLQRRPPDSKAAAAGALRRRDAWIARQADEALVVWDGEDPSIGRLVRSLQDALGEEEVWVIPPVA